MGADDGSDDDSELDLYSQDPKPASECESLGSLELPALDCRDGDLLDFCEPARTLNDAYKSLEP